MTETKKYPAYVEAAEVIADRVEQEGFGFIVGLDELHDLLSVEKPEGMITPERYREIALEMLGQLEGLKVELLEKFKIFLMNIHGQGYQAVTPSEQVQKGFKKHMGRMLKEHRKAMRVLTHVRHEMLSHEALAHLDSNLTKAVFIGRSLRRRKFPVIEQKKIAQK